MLPRAWADRIASQAKNGENRINFRAGPTSWTDQLGDPATTGSDESFRSARCPVCPQCPKPCDSRFGVGIEVRRQPRPRRSTGARKKAGARAPALDDSQCASSRRRSMRSSLCWTDAKAPSRDTSLCMNAAIWALTPRISALASRSSSRSPAISARIALRVSRSSSLVTLSDMRISIA